MTLPVILQIKRRIQKREVREEPLCRNLARQPEQIVVGVLRLIVDSLFDLEDMDWEDRGFPVSQPFPLCQQDAADDQPALRRGVGAVVEGAERGLRSGTGVHGVQAVDERLHRPVGFLLRFLLGVPMCKALCLLCLLLGAAQRRSQLLSLCPVVLLVALQTGRQPLLFQPVKQLRQLARSVAQQLTRLFQIAPIAAAVGLSDARRHVEVKLWYALTAVLVVLIGLNRRIGKRRIGCDVLRLAQIAVSGVKAAVEQPGQVDLTAGGGQRKKIQIMNVDVAAVVGARVLRVQHEHLVERLRTLRAVAQHGAHRGVAIDICILPLDVILRRALKGQVLVHLHQGGVHLPHPGSLCAVEDILLGGAGVSVLDQHLLHHILNLLHRRRLVLGGGFLQPLLHLLCQPLSRLIILAAHRGRCPKDCPGNLLDVVGCMASVALDDSVDHEHSPLACKHKKRARPLCPMPLL